VNVFHDLSTKSFALTAIVVGSFIALGLIGGVALWSSERGPVLPEDGVMTSAKVKFIGIEGGCWMLDTRYGSFLAPSLPKEFRVDGLKVAAKIQLARSQAHYCPMGRGIVLVTNVARSGA
jgi:hypothetical protein